MVFSANKADIPGEFSVRQASSCNQRNWSEKQPTNNPWEPVVVFGRSNNTCIDPARNPKHQEQREETIRARDIFHMKLVTAI